MRVICTIQGYVFLALGMTVTLLGLVKDDVFLLFTGVIISGIGSILWRLGR